MSVKSITQFGDESLVFHMENGKTYSMSQIEQYIAEMEKQKPKPLLADAQEGDIVKLRNGEYARVYSVDCSEWSLPVCIKFEDGYLWYYPDGTCMTGLSEHDIISVEPLAAEGTAEWALQQMKLGKKVSATYGNGIYYYENDRVYINKKSYDAEHWVKLQNDIGVSWQLYEPKPEIAYACDTCRYNGQCTYTENKPRRIACNDYLAIEPVEPAPRPKAWDWVEVDYYNEHRIARIKHIELSNITYKLLGAHEWKTNKNVILRIIPKSEVKVSITLSGTVVMPTLPITGNTRFQLMVNGTSYIIYYSDLTPADAEMVRVLVGEK